MAFQLMPRRYMESYSNPLVCEIILRKSDNFEPTAVDQFLHQSYTVSQEQSRMGYRQALEYRCGQTALFCSDYTWWGSNTSVRTADCVDARPSVFRGLSFNWYSSSKVVGATRSTQSWAASVFSGSFSDEARVNFISCRNFLVTFDSVINHENDDEANADVGEGFGVWSMGDDAALMPHIDMANVACGGHASDPLTMQRTVRLAKQYGVMVGAHPSYPDVAGFGRRSLPMPHSEAALHMLAQLVALATIASSEGVTIDYVKPHGALYNRMIDDLDLMEELMMAMATHLYTVDDSWYGGYQTYQSSLTD